MTYPLLLLAVICCGSQSVFAKFYNSKAKRQNTYLYSAVVTIVALLFFVVTAGKNLSFNAGTAVYSAAFGIAYALATVGNVCALTCGPLSLSSLIQQFSLILPTMYGLVFLHERMGILGYVGIVLVFVCLFAVNPKSTDKSIALSPKWFVYVILSFVGNGMCSVIQKMQQLHFDGAYKNEFMIMALVIAAVIMIIGAVKNRGDIKGELADALKVAPMQGVANGATNMLVMILSALLPTAVLFPAVLAGGIVISFTASVFMFGEKLTKRQIIGYVIGIVSIVLINM